ncbi:Bacterial alpha-L-rhamnosidase [Penicillium expansum]|nr:Bacterial alpha-L-rhamnosidase [Penicillium expansum]
MSHKDEPLRPLLFRKEFVLPGGVISVRRARLYITAFGVYRAYLNGSRIGDHEMAPGWTSYHNRLAYQVFDVDSLVYQHGSNVLSVEVAEGWYAGRLGFGGGKRRHIRRSDGSHGSVGARTTEILTPRKIIITPSGRNILDFGQNLVGKLLIHSMTLPLNATVSFTHAEVMDDNGELGTRPLRGAQCVDTIISSGQSFIDWSPKFTFHGFRFVQVDGWDPRNGAVLAEQHSGADCPQRDERLGWTGDIQVFGPSATFLYDSISMLSEWMEDVACEQSDHHGVPPLVVPNILDHVWPSIPQALWAMCMTLWLNEGVCRGEDGLWDPELWQLGDWLDPQAPPDEPGDCRTSGTLVADAYLVHVTSLMAKIASILERETDITHYSCKAKRLRALFQDKYITLSGLIVGDSQTAYSLAIVFGLLSTQQQLATARYQLAMRVRMAKFRVATGFAGTPLVLRALTDTGNLSLAYRMLLEDRCPSWLYPISMGATTIWERWDSMLPNGSINPGEMTSFNHYALGSVVNWLHETVGGLRPLEPGWKTALVFPQPGGSLTHSAVSYESIYGRWSCQWSIGHDTDRDGALKFCLDLTVPPNCQAVVKVKGAKDGSNNLEENVGSGKHQWSIPLYPLPWPPQATAPFITNPGQGVK